MDSINPPFSLRTASPKEVAAYLNPRKEITQEEQERRFQSAFEPLYYQAEIARAYAKSYRGFKVGCAMYGFRRDASRYSDLWRAFYGANTKILKDSRNICAEPTPLNVAETSGYTQIIGMVIVGQPQEDERGITPATLRPCKECRLLMKHSPLMRPETIIVTAHPPVEGQIPVLEEMTFEELLREYGEL